MYSQFYMYSPLKQWSMFDVFSFLADFLNLQDVHYKGKHEFSARSIYGGVDTFEDVQVLRRVIVNSIDGSRLMSIVGNNNLARMLGISSRLSQQVVKGLQQYWEMGTDVSVKVTDDVTVSTSEVEELDRCLRSRVRLLKDELRLKDARRRIQPLQAELLKTRAEEREMKHHAQVSGTSQGLKQLRTTTTDRLRDLQARLQHLNQLAKELEESVSRDKEAHEALSQRVCDSYASRQSELAATVEQQQKAQRDLAMQREDVEFEVSMMTNELKHQLASCYAPVHNQKQRVDRKVKLDGIMQLILFAESMSNKVNVNPNISSKVTSLKHSCSLLLDMCPADKYLDIVESQLGLSRACQDEQEDAEETLTSQRDECKRAMELATDLYKRTGAMEIMSPSLSILDEQIAALDDRLARVLRRKRNLHSQLQPPSEPPASDDSEDKPYVNETVFKRIMLQVVEQEKEQALKAPPPSLYSLQLWFATASDPQQLSAETAHAGEEDKDAPAAADSSAAWASNLKLPAV